MSATLDDRRDVAAIHPLKFWVEYEDVKGELVAKDWVQWVKKGDAFGSTTSEKVARAEKDASVWAVIEPHYKAWKAGQDAPVNGMPLDAAPFMTRELAEVLKRVHVRSVEDFAALEDAAITRLNLPGMRAMQKKAKAFLDAQASLSGVASEVAMLRDMVEQLRAEKAEAEATAQQFASESGRRRRSREEVMAQAPGE